MLRVLLADPKATLRGLAEAGRQRSFGRRTVQPKSVNQRRYLEAIESHDMVFGIGPAGTGKTYLAVAMAISALLSKRVNRIILARPAVEAGERLGFLPGTLQDKIDPYLRPLYDALYDMLEPEKVDRYLEKNVIEIAPIAFMRGPHLNDSFVILDEAQNTTSEQMKMFVTRLGFNSKAVITGDMTQIDLPNARRSGLLEAIDILKRVQGLAFAYFDDGDVVRHHLVQRIIRAYDEPRRRPRSPATDLHANGNANGSEFSALGRQWRRKGRCAFGSRNQRVEKISMEGAGTAPPFIFSDHSMVVEGGNRADGDLRKYVAGLRTPIWPGL